MEAIVSVFKTFFRCIPGGAEKTTKIISQRNKFYKKERSWRPSKAMSVPNGAIASKKYA
jgi:hypothetical protein